MRSYDFQWFVAWRYLLERPRRLSGLILGSIALFLWCALGAGAAYLWYPLTEAFYIPPPNLPVWMPLAFGLALAGTVTALLAALARAALTSHGEGLLVWERRPGPARSPRGALLLAVYGGLVSLAMVGGYAWLRARDPFADDLAVLWLFERSRVITVLSVIGAVPIALFVCRHSRLSRGARGSLWGLIGVVSALLTVPAAYGVVEAVAPAIAERGRGAAVFGTIAGVGVLAVVVGVSLLQNRLRRVSVLPDLVLLGVALVCLASATSVLLSGHDLITEYLELIGGWGAVKDPMWMLIPAYLTGALAALALILLVIRYVFTFFTTVSIGGVAIGTMALVVVLSVMAGFETDLRNKILGSNAHVLVTRDDDVQFSSYRDVLATVAEAPGVEATTPFLLSEVVIAANNNYANVIIKGIDPRTVGTVTDLADNLEEGPGLDALWPLDDDGNILGPPDHRAGLPGKDADASDANVDGDVVDPAPEDMDLPSPDIVDFSGGVTELPAEPEVVDPAPEDMDLPEAEVFDFSGGVAELPDDDEPPGDAGPGAGMAPLRQDDPDGGVVGEDYEAELDDYIPPHVARLPGVLVGRELVKQINLYVGEEVKVISPLGQDTPLGPVPRTKPFRVAGLFYTGMYEYDLKYIYVELTALQDFLDLGDEINGIEVRVEDPERTSLTVAALQQTLGPGYRVQDWKDLNRSLFSALKLEKIAMFLVLVIIILVASFSIVGNLIMVVVEKAKEIAILKTLGTPDRGVMKIFVVQGFFIGLVGTAIGVTLGLTICWGLIHYGLPLDPDVYYIDRLPVQVEATSIIAVAAAGVAISVVATVYPAFVAARLRPVSGLRYE